MLGFGYQNVDPWDMWGGGREGRKHTVHPLSPDARLYFNKENGNSSYLPLSNRLPDLVNSTTLVSPKVPKICIKTSASVPAPKSAAVFTLTRYSTERYTHCQLLIVIIMVWSRSTLDDIYVINVYVHARFWTILLAILKSLCKLPAVFPVTLCMVQFSVLPPPGTSPPPPPPEFDFLFWFDVLFPTSGTLGIDWKRTASFTMRKKSFRIKTWLVKSKPFTKSDINISAWCFNNNYWLHLLSNTDFSFDRLFLSSRSFKLDSGLLEKYSTLFDSTVSPH